MLKRLASKALSYWIYTTWRSSANCHMKKRTQTTKSRQSRLNDSYSRQKRNKKRNGIKQITNNQKLSTQRGKFLDRQGQTLIHYILAALTCCNHCASTEVIKSWLHTTASEDRKAIPAIPRALWNNKHDSAIILLHCRHCDILDILRDIMSNMINSRSQNLRVYTVGYLTSSSPSVTSWLTLPGSVNAVPSLHPGF